MQQPSHVLHFQSRTAPQTQRLNAWLSEVRHASICVLKSLATFLTPLFNAQVWSFHYVLVVGWFVCL